MRNLITVIIIIQTLFCKAQQPILQGVYRWDSVLVKNENGRLRRQLLEGSTTFLSYVSVHATTIQVGKSPHAPHTHKDQDEMIIVKEGKLQVTIKGVSETLEVGNIAFAMAGDEHGILNVGDTPATYYIFRFQSKVPTNTEQANKNGGSFFLTKDKLIFKPHDKGGRTDYFNHATSQLSYFEMHTTNLNANIESHPPHTHLAEEIILVTKGDVEVFIDGKTYKATKGDVIFYPSNLPHALKNIGKEQTHYFAPQWRN